MKASGRICTKKKWSAGRIALLEKTLQPLLDGIQHPMMLLSMEQGVLLACTRTQATAAAQNPVILSKSRRHLLKVAFNADAEHTA
jgi:hypothetical protein